MTAPLPATRRAILRRAVALAAPLAGIPGAARAKATATRHLAAAWNSADNLHWLGLLASSAPGDPLRVLHRLELPTRAHGLLVEPGGSVLAVARRPGDWMLRWQPGTQQPPQWCWSAQDRRFCGHVQRTAQGLWTTEVDLERQHGIVALRDIRTLQTVAEWPTHGIDPHMVITDGDDNLLVANGGVPTLPETGRFKLDRTAMDPSLVRLRRRDGALLGQWRLDDPRLSIRHLARHADGTVGISLQAEHDDADQRMRAPLLARFDGKTLRTSPWQPDALAGYGGDIAATRGGFALAATRAGQLTFWGSDGRWQGAVPLPQACPLALVATTPGLGAAELWAGGAEQALQRVDDGRTTPHGVGALRLDNHWAAWTRSAGV
jgi:hypothetical protein